MRNKSKTGTDDLALRRSKNAADLLAKAELFSGLDRVTLARLAANLEPMTFHAGEAACLQGEAGDSFYLVSEGRFGVFVRSSGDDANATSEVRVATLERGGCFGEMALLTGEPRSATVRADGRGELLRLDKERFSELLRSDPQIGLALSASLSRRLRVASQNLNESDRYIRSSLEARLRLLAPDLRLRVLQASVLERLDEDGLTVLFGGGTAELLRTLAELGWTQGKPPSALTESLRAIWTQEAGASAVSAWVIDAIERLAASGHWSSALQLAERFSDRADFLTLIRRALRAEPAIAPEVRRYWLGRLTDTDAALDPEIAAERASLHEATRNPVATTRRTRARVVMRPAVRPRLSRVIAVTASLVFLGAAIVVSPWSKMAAFLFLLASAIALWLVAILPEFVVYLALVVAWVLLGIVKPAQAIAGFGSVAWISIFAILAIGSALSASGLVYRLGLLLVRRLPSGLFAQGAAYLGSGLLLTLLVPSSAARARLLLPTALAAAQSQRFKDRSPESAFLGLAAFVGVGPLLYVFLNGSSANLLGLGLMPEATRAQFDLAFWFIAAAPLAAFVALGSLAFLWLTLRPKSARQAAHSQIDLQLTLLGRATGHEIVMGAILLALVVGWNVGPAYGLNSAIVGLACVVASALTGCLSRRSLQELNWDFLISFGVILSLPPIMSSLGIDRELTDAVRGIAGDTRLSPALFVIATGLLNIGVRFLLPRGQTMLLVAIILIPMAPVFDVHPFVVIITVLSTFSLWFLPGQSVSYIVAAEASEQRLFSHRQAQRFCFGFTAITLVGLVLALPYWRWLGLM